MHCDKAEYYVEPKKGAACSRGQQVSSERECKTKACVTTDSSSKCTKLKKCDALAREMLRHAEAGFGAELALETRVQTGVQPCTGACATYRWKALGRRGHFEYRHICTRAIGMPSAMPIKIR